MLCGSRCGRASLRQYVHKTNTIIGYHLCRGLSSEKCEMRRIRKCQPDVLLFGVAELPDFIAPDALARQIAKRAILEL